MKSRVEALTLHGVQISMLKKQENRYFWCSLIKNINKHKVQFLHQKRNPTDFQRPTELLHTMTVIAFLP